MFHATPCAAGGAPLPIKINLYRGIEVDAVADAIAEDPLLARAIRLDCMMVSDSFLMTHLGRDSTRLDVGERSLFLDIMVDMVREVSRHVRERFPRDIRPDVVGDMPDGATRTIDAALQAAGSMINAGADIIKIEAHDYDTFEKIATLAAEGIRVMAHLGYTPQVGDGGRVGGTPASAQNLLDMVAAARTAGAVSLVLEKVDPLLHALIADEPDALPSYAIFSGRSLRGGQSLNVWDAVFRPGFEARYFPPTARHDVADRDTVYGRPTIARAIGDLLRLTAIGEFPRDTPSTVTDTAVRRLA